jgi:hypothetical protein
MKWTEYVLEGKRYEILAIFLLESPKGRDHLENLGIGGRIILE